MPDIRLNIILIIPNNNHYPIEYQICEVNKLKFMVKTHTHTWINDIILINSI